MDGDTGELPERAPLVVGGEDQIEVEGAEQGEHLTSVGGVHADDLVQQDGAGCIRYGLVVGRHSGEEREVQSYRLLAARQGTMQLLGEELSSRAVGAV
ncbi:hypothetical protein GCM10018793_12070 [Streptomyces sulfonofaciens]|uniref:Uncharacterized protein n=1 Tax=Streptomyces sulfonofaciens TaxID=68272 RepID=A0A919FW79_9ACTN|nr:hypothetical protein GCM10018793_12070 [Streptomyces sulfonofaciens]